MKIFYFAFLLTFAVYCESEGVESVDFGTKKDQKEDSIEEIVRKDDLQREKVDSIEPLKFDLKAFEDEMDQFDCYTDKNSPNYKEEYNQLCPENIEQNAFTEVGDFNDNYGKFWDKINEQVYLPLTYELPRKTSLSEIL